MVRVNRFFQFMEYIVRIFRFFIPWVWRAFVFTLSWLATSFIAFWAQVPDRASRIADSWLDRAVAAGFPTQWDSRLYQVLWILAFATISLGWIVLSFLTVGLITLVF